MRNFVIALLVGTAIASDEVTKPTFKNHPGFGVAKEDFHACREEAEGKEARAECRSAFKDELKAVREEFQGWRKEARSSEGIQAARDSYKSCMREAEGQDEAAVAEIKAYCLPRF